MRINNINPVSFKAHYVNVDIGASSALGSMKIRTLDDKGNLIDYYKTTVFDEDQKRSEQKFEQSVANKIAGSEYRNAGRIAKADPDNEMYLTVCYPGPKITENGEDGFRLPNFYFDDNRTRRFERAIKPDNIDKYLAAQGVNLVQSRHANDMAGAGACILDKLEKEHPELLKEGEDILFLYPGGGLGCGILSVDKNDIKIKPMEMGHIQKNGGKGKTLESDVGVPGLINNFATRLELNGAERKIIGNDARAVRDYEVFSEYLPYIHPAEFRFASVPTVHEFIDSLAELVAIQICASKTKSVVLTGNVANGTRDIVNKSNYYESKPEYQADGADKFTAIFREMVDKKLNPVGQAIVGDKTGLTVTFVDLKDNTEGAEVLQKCEEVGKPAKWYNMTDV